jgi:hypothetical protein
MEEDDPLQVKQLMIRADMGPGRTFTLFLYDRHANRVRVCGEREGALLLPAPHFCACVCGGGGVPRLLRVQFVWSSQASHGSPRRAWRLPSWFSACGDRAPTHPPRVATLASLQTVVRRLKQTQMSQPSLNPFIERTDDGAVQPHSLATAGPASASPVPEPMGSDLVLPGRYLSDEPLPATFSAALRRVLALTREELAGLASADLTAVSLFVDNCLCAVRWPCGRRGVRVRTLTRTHTLVCHSAGSHAPTL